MNEHIPHILILDDDSQICDLLKEFLSRHGIKVSIANQGQQMHKAIKDTHFDLIVLDIMMPGKDGLQLCKKM